MRLYKCHDKACGEYIDYLADTLRADLKNILRFALGKKKNFSFFPITTPGVVSGGNRKPSGCIRRK